MLAPYRKAIGAFLSGIVSLAVAFNWLPADLVTPEVLGGIATVAATLATYLLPNTPPPGGTSAQSPVAAVIAAVALSAMLMGCATTPETPRQGLYVADATFTAAVEELITLRDAGVLRPGSDAEILARRVVQNVNTALEAAHAAARIGDIDGVAGYLRAVNAGLSTLTKLITQTRSISNAERDQFSPVADRCGGEFLLALSRYPADALSGASRGPRCDRRRAGRSA